MLDTIDSRRTGHLDEVQATAALRNMGLAVTNHEAASFLRTVATTAHNGTCVLRPALARARARVCVNL